MHIHLYDSELNGGQGSSQTHLEKTIHPALSSPHELVALRSFLAPELSQLTIHKNGEFFESNF